MTKPKIAVVGIPGKWSTEVLADRLESLTGFRSVIDMADVTLQFDTQSVMCNGQDLRELDGIIVKKISEIYAPDAEDRTRVLSYLEASGVRVFSPSHTIAQMINRLSGTLALQQGQIPMPSTRITENVQDALKAVRTFGSAILKPLYSTKARGMQIIDETLDDAQALAVLTAFKAEHGLFYIQKTIALNGKDLGMVFLGGEYVCTYARVAASDAWNTTIHSGGHYENYLADEALIELGRRAQACYDLSFTTVDIALTDEGPYVFEVSAFGGFKGAKEGCGIDVAQRYAEYVVNQLQQTKRNKISKQANDF